MRGPNTGAAAHSAIFGLQLEYFSSSFVNAFVMAECSESTIAMSVLPISSASDLFSNVTGNVSAAFKSDITDTIYTFFPEKTKQRTSPSKIATLRGFKINSVAPEGLTENDSMVVGSSTFFSVFSRMKKTHTPWGDVRA